MIHNINHKYIKDLTGYFTRYDQFSKPDYSGFYEVRFANSDNTFLLYYSKDKDEFSGFITKESINYSILGAKYYRKLDTWNYHRGFCILNLNQHKVLSDKKDMKLGIPYLAVENISTHNILAREKHAAIFVRIDNNHFLANDYKSYTYATGIKPIIIFDLEYIMNSYGKDRKIKEII